MTTFERLNRVRDSYAELRRLADKVEELETIATKITPVLSPTPRSDSPMPKDEIWARLIDYKAMCEEKLTDYIKASTELEEELTCIRSKNIRTAMNYYYVDRRKQYEIANAMGYSDREIRYFLQKGRQIYEEAFKSK